jgi:hypothetical protein
MHDALYVALPFSFIKTNMEVAYFSTNWGLIGQSSPAAGRIYVPEYGVQQTSKWREEGWLAFLITRTDDEYVDLISFDTAECLRLDCQPGTLNNVLPLGFVKKLSLDRLLLSYYHGGIRSRINESFKYKKT